MNTRGFQIRPMQPDDVEAVLAIAGELKEAPHWAAAVYARAVDPKARPLRVALVACGQDGRVAGFAIAVLVPPEAELETIGVAGPAQRQGIGGRILAELAQELIARGITEVMLEVRESNQGARALYGACGFLEIGRRGGYYADPREDAILLRRELG